MYPLCQTVKSMPLSGCDTAKQSFMATRHGQGQCLEQKEPAHEMEDLSVSPHPTLSGWVAQEKHQIPWHVFVSSLKVGEVFPDSQA